MRKLLAAVLVAAALAALALGVAQLGHATSSRIATTSGDVFAQRFDDNMVVAGTPAAPTLVLQKSALPAGSYVVTAKLIAFGAANSFARVVCQAKLGTGVDTTSTTVGVKKGASEDQSVALLLATTTASTGNARVVCWPEEATGRPPQVSIASMVVMPVASISP